MTLFAIRGTTLVLCHTFRGADRVAVNPGAPTVQVFHYVDGAPVDVVASSPMVSDGVLGQYRYSWSVDPLLAAHETLYVRFRGTNALSHEVLDTDASVTVLDVGGFGRGPRASFVREA